MAYLRDLCAFVAVLAFIGAFAVWAGVLAGSI